MSMVARCPSCDTTFRVTSTQLQAHRGMVRCGRCSKVFDGFKSLATLNEATAVEPAVVVADAEPTRGPPTQKPLSSRERRTDAAAESSVAREAYGVRSEPKITRAEDTADDVIKAAQPIADFYFSEQPPASRSRRVVLALVAVVLCLILAAQALYYYRGEIAGRAPNLRRPLDQMCAVLRCTVELPQRPKEITIEASDIKSIDPEHPGRILLTATLRSRGTSTVGYPAFDVALTDIQEHTVVRRIFQPKEYLEPGKDARAGLAPNAELTVRLDLDSGDLGASGFRLDLLPATAR